MLERNAQSDAISLIRFASFLLIVYLIVLAIVNLISGPPQHNAQYYYIFYGFIAALCLCLAYWTWIQNRLGKAFVPLIIIILTVGPIISNWFITNLSPFNMPSSPDNPVLRPLPFLFIGLLLVAWQYKWQYILLIVLGIAGLNLATVWTTSQPHTGPFMGGLNITLIQTVIFLALGFSISYLMTRLREQQRSLERANISLTHYASTLESLATSRERNRLARELHDTLAHTLSGLSVQLETVKAYWDMDNQTARATMEKSLQAAHEGMEETRRALKALRASPLDDLGLELALRTMLKDTTASSHLEYELIVQDTMPVLSPDVEQCIYRVAQEAVTNAFYHASAKKIAVKLEYTGEKASLTIVDDGQGFDIDKINNSGHFGLVGIREWAQLVGGDLKIDSKPGSGTTVQLTI